MKTLLTTTALIALLGAAPAFAAEDAAATKEKPTANDVVPDANAQAPAAEPDQATQPDAATAPDSNAAAPAASRFSVLACSVSRAATASGSDVPYREASMHEASNSGLHRIAQASHSRDRSSRLTKSVPPVR